VSARPVPPAQLWWLGGGFALWGSALAMLYAVHAVGCVFAWPSVRLRLCLALLLLAHLAAIGWLWRGIAQAGPGRDFGRTGVFLHKLILWTVIAAFATTILTLGPPLMMLDLCG
jgi:hypothetical protein